MKTHAYNKVKISVLIAGFILAVTVAAAVYLPNKPMVEQINNPHIVSISATVGQGGKTFNYDIPKSKISNELNDTLISMFLNSEMKAAFFPPPPTYTISDDSLYVTIKVSLDNHDFSSMRVNLCTDPQYDSAQFGDTHYHIINHQKLYQNVYDLLCGIIPISK